jgi:ABC-type uncharacterized transport system substrate-binding protein
MKPFITKGFVCLLLLASQATVQSVLAAEKNPRITLLLSGNTEIHLQTMRGFKQRFDEYGDITAILDVRRLIDDNNADSIDITTPDSDLIIAIGSRATRKLVETDIDTPALSIVTPKVTFNALVNSSESARKRHRSGKLAGIVLDQPPSRRMRLIRSVLPGPRRIGMLWGPTSRQESAEYQAAAHAAGLELDEAVVDEDANPIPLIEGLIKGNDALLAVYDSVALNPSTSKWLLYLAYQNRVPVIGFSRAYVDAGALAAVYSTPEQIGKQAAEVVYDFIGANPGILPVDIYPRYFGLGLNRSVARSIGLTPPDEDLLLQQLIQAEKGEQAQ